MDNFGLVSIITPSYNSSSFIAETIESILSQTYLNWELLITDDCSTDRSVEIIERYIQRDSRIKLFRLEKNCGADEFPDKEFIYRVYEALGNYYQIAV
ncbi:glycosyltransferase family 2 protein, partial [Parabacteroides distasonis]|uniref:glycosyltransferase family 2 protein n=1 Tax=Parabacteroides distasonis TaxID=823 RepID=UPI0039B45D0A